MLSTASNPIALARMYQAGLPLDKFWEFMSDDEVETEMSTSRRRRLMERGLLIRIPPRDGGKPRGWLRKALRQVRCCDIIVC